ncbi:MICAL-like protein 1 [Penaeus japonicus]|uniref:MICAL-like protein 1 n=1 Tax=Penaeus japonicus TaxID=27405 RepID=UPI001C70D331|nr:MICAL-like protein 1 [Penaeus japonicus]
MERGPSFEVGSSDERASSFEVGSSMERGSSYEREYSRRKQEARLVGSSAEQAQSGYLDRDSSLEEQGVIRGTYEFGSSLDSYDQEELRLRGHLELSGSAGGSLDLGGSLGESVEIGGSMDSEEPPMPPPRVPRRGGRSPAMPPTEAEEDGGQLAAPTPPPRSRRPGSRASTVSESSALGMEEGQLPIYIIGAEGGLAVAPTPPPRSRRPGSRASSTLSESLGMEDPLYLLGMVEGGQDLAPTPPPRSRRPGSRASTVSDTSALGWSPTPPRRRKRPKSEAVGAEAASMEFEESFEDSPTATPRRRRRQASQVSSGTSETPVEAITPTRGASIASSDVEFESAQAAPDSTPSPSTSGASVTARMEAVKVAAGGDAVLVVSLENIQAAKISW